MKNSIKNPYALAIVEIEDGLWEHDIRVDEGIVAPYNYDNNTFRAALKIFMSAVMWKMWERAGEKPLREKVPEVEECGNEIRDIVKRYCGIDTHDLYREGTE